MLDRFSDRIDELEAVVREIAIDISTITFVEKIPAEQIREKTEPRVTLVNGLIKELKEYLFILKPEKVPTIQRQVASISERLELFREALKGVTINTEERAQSPIDELRQALVEISGFISLCRETKASPSNVIKSILTLRESQKPEVQPVTEVRIQHLGNIIKDAQASLKDIKDKSMMMGNQLDDLKSEYETLLFSVRKKEE